MRLGLGSYAYAWAIGVPGYPSPARPMDALGLVRRAAELGLCLVQICDNLPLHSLPSLGLDDLASAASAMGVQVTVGTRGISQDHLATYLRLAERFASPILRVVVDTESARPSQDEIVSSLRQFAPGLENAGVCLAIENHDRFKARDLAAILERIDSTHVGVCLDTVNSFGALEGPEAVVSALAPWVVDLHIKDFVIGRAAHKMGFVLEGRPAGQGQLDVSWLIGTLQEHGRDPDAVLELWPPPAADIESTIRKEDAWAVQSIVYLRELIPG